MRSLTLFFEQKGGCMQDAFTTLNKYAGTLYSHILPRARSVYVDLYGAISREPSNAPACPAAEMQSRLPMLCILMH